MMWTPTHIELVVLRARHLVGKGKAGTNDAYVVMQLGKAKYQTSVQDKAIDPEWNEECDFELPTEASAIELTVLHKDVIGLDKFLGRCLIMLADLDEYGMPLTRWVELGGRHDNKDSKYRGELEVRLTCIVRNHTEASPEQGKLKKAAAVGSRFSTSPTVSGTS
ncbi:PREDICTED: rab11 family-interacting protein 2-like isoform X2 [Priapulus caudatus]|uniref:Rab11 family-interacting protein 2-like isoform X2 n=1 Tax=Priapulus caudatus TaxID=37621 RepID=A0ABM1E449_PRICU|nr:PREDICTED: rab11 family-interacting protein 2-like isoform X2 [Priapulus caudatus]